MRRRVNLSTGWTLLKSSATWFTRHELTDRAAALTYYAVLSVFPGLLVLVATLGLLSAEATETLVAGVVRYAPQDVADAVTGGIGGLQASPFTAGMVALAGLAGAVWSASGYVGAFMRASNTIYQVTEGRPAWKKYGVRLGITLTVGALLIVSTLIIVFTGRLADVVGEFIGFERTFVRAWDLAKWPVLVFIVSLIFAILFWASPNARVGRFNPVSPGGLLAVLVWIVVSAGFALYLANFASYNRTYGALGGIIGFLVWLWISNSIVLFGAVFNAQWFRHRAGLPADGGGVAPRDTARSAEDRANST